MHVDWDEVASVCGVISGVIALLVWVTKTTFKSFLTPVAQEIRRLTDSMGILNNTINKQMDRQEEFNRRLEKHSEELISHDERIKHLEDGIR